MRSSIEQRRQELAARYPSWEPRTLAQHLAVTAATHPDRTFVVGTSPPSERTYTYAEMRDWSRGLARGFVALGVRPGEHVALVMANYPELIAVEFALSSIGAVAVPLNFLFRRDELRYVVRQSDSAVLVTMERFGDLDYLQMFDELAPGWERAGGGEAFPRLRRVVTFSPAGPSRSGATALADVVKAGERVDDAQIDALERAGRAEDLADIIYTSGTTGFPKGAMLTHENLLRCAYASALIRAFEDGRRILFALPLYHVFAYVEGLLAATFVGGAVVPQLTFDPVATFDAIQRHRVSEALFVPTMTVALVEHPKRGDYDLSSLHTVMSAAAPAPVRLWQQVREELGVREIVTAYGQTEVSASSTFTMPDDPLELVSATVGRGKPGGAAGDPGLGADRELGPLVTVYKTVDPFTGEDLPQGQEGELAVRGPEVMRGYYNEPEETAAVLDERGWLRSGDLGRVRPDGYVELTGRSRELYKCGGELVAPKEVEDVLTGRPDVGQAYVVGVPDERMGEIGCAFVVPAQGRQPSAKELLEFCRSSLARFKVPRHVFFLVSDELPATPTGKVRKFRLADDARARLAESRHVGSLEAT
ncbi:MAG: AMP-binding protein [Streptosporangiaceae bacterium]